MTAALTKPSTINIDLIEDEDTLTGPVVDEDRPGTIEGKFGPDVVNEDLDPLDQLPEDAVRHDDGSVTLPLNYKVTVVSQKGGKLRERVFEELVFHRLNGADQQVIADAPERKMIAVTFARSTRLHQALMDAVYAKMDLSDIARAGRVLNFFVSNGRKTGG